VCRSFLLPAGAGDVGIVIAHQGGFPIGWFVVGYDTWFRKPTTAGFHDSADCHTPHRPPTGSSSADGRAASKYTLLFAATPPPSLLYIGPPSLRFSAYFGIIRRRDQHPHLVSFTNVMAVFVSRMVTE